MKSYGLTIAGLLALQAIPASALADGLEAKIAELQRQIDQLKQERVQPSAAEVAQKPALMGDFQSLKFGGQYRINGYTATNDSPSAKERTAARARIRQSVDIGFTEEFKSHLQLELGHTTDNLTTSNNSSRSTSLAVRHAEMDYQSKGGFGFQAGLVPLSDRFDDLLFSSDWDYNPLALSVKQPLFGGDLRVFAANLRETKVGLGSGGEAANDDTVHYQADYGFRVGSSTANFGGSFVSLSPDAGSQTARANHLNAGAGLRTNLGFGDLKTSILWSHTDKSLIGSTSDGSGVAGKVEMIMPIGQSKVSLMGTHATGKSNGSGFLPVMAMPGTNGYWGYTGVLTIQGPTDTGIDGDSVNISNNGYGLTTAQAKLVYPFTEAFTGTVSAGWFGNTNAAGRDSTVGIDGLVMGTYKFNKFLSLDFGADVAKLGDSVSGYSNKASTGAAPAFNQAVGEDRTKAVLFTRLQAEF